MTDRTGDGFGSTAPSPAGPYVIDLGTVCSRWDYDAHEPAEKTIVQQVRGTRGIHFRAKLDIDADGAPAGYHPADKSPPQNSGRAYDWLDNLHLDDRHGIQGQDGVGPAPGFVISGTTVENRRFPVNDARRYVDASSIPYVVLPRNRIPLPQDTRVRDGTILFVVDCMTGGSTGAMFADAGRAVGEGSILLAQRLGLRPFSRTRFPKVIGFNSASDAKRFFYILFPDVVVAPPWPVDNIESLAWTAFQAWGGEAMLHALVSGLPPLRRAQTAFDEAPLTRKVPAGEVEGEIPSRGRARDVPKREIDADGLPADVSMALAPEHRLPLGPAPTSTLRTALTTGTYNPDAAPDPQRVELSAQERATLPLDPSAETGQFRPQERDAPEDALPEAPASVRVALPEVRWPASDSDAPCYAHLVPEPGDVGIGEPTFTFTADALELLIKANAFVPAGYADRIVFALRGARLIGDAAFETVDSLKLADVRPDHRAFHCTIGIYNRANRKLSAFRASTVAHADYMANYYRKVHDIQPYRDIEANMLPTGCYVYRVEHHRDIYPALRLTDPEQLHLDGKVAVLRSSNDLTFALDDVWDPCFPYDNLHCAYSDTTFFSAGCLTIMGRDRRGPWGRFQDVLRTMPRGARLDVLLLTGREAAIAAQLSAESLTTDQELADKWLTRLRPGSQGEAVRRLQGRMGMQQTGYFGAQTKKILTERQRAANLPPDGIYAPRVERQLKWGVLSVVATSPDETRPPRTSGAGPAISLAPSPSPAPEPLAPATGLGQSLLPPAGDGTGIVPTLEQLRSFASRDARPDYLDIMAQGAGLALGAHAINANSMRFCHFMGQVGNECGGFRITHESLYYTTAEQLCRVWPSRFPTLASARPYLRNEHKLAENVYGGRLGNTQPGDGFRYRGRGFLQITGRENYRVMGRKIAVDLEHNPDLAADPAIALKIAAQTWMDKALAGERDMNALSDLNKLEALTYRVNGGYTNIDDRRANFEKAWRLWGEGPPPAGVGEPKTVERGDRGPLVTKLKDQLIALGYPNIGGGSIFGSKLYEALCKFQREHALTPTGVAGEETWAALERALDRQSRKGSSRSIPEAADAESPAAPRPEPLPRSLREALKSIRNVNAALAATAVVFALAYLAGLTNRLGAFSLWLPLLFAGATFIMSFIAWHWATGVPSYWEMPRTREASRPEPSRNPVPSPPDEPDDAEPVRMGAPNLEHP